MTMMNDDSYTHSVDNDDHTLVADGDDEDDDHVISSHSS